MHFCLKKKEGRRLCSTVQTKNRGRRSGGKKSNSIAIKCIIHWGRIERQIGWWDRNTYGANIFLFSGLCPWMRASVGERQEKTKQKAMNSQSIIANDRFSHSILLIELNPDLIPPLQIDWRRAIDVPLEILWLSITLGWKRLWLTLSFNENTTEIKWHDKTVNWSSLLLDLLWFSTDSSMKSVSDSLVTQAPIKAELWIWLGQKACWHYSLSKRKAKKNPSQNNQFLCLSAVLFPTMRHCWLMREECQSEVTLLNLAVFPLALMCLCFQSKTQHTLSLVHLTGTVMMQANTAPS